MLEKDTFLDWGSCSKCHIYVTKTHPDLSEQMIQMCSKCDIYVTKTHPDLSEQMIQMCSKCDIYVTKIYSFNTQLPATTSTNLCSAGFLFSFFHNIVISDFCAILVKGINLILSLLNCRKDNGSKVIPKPCSTILSTV